MQYFALTATPDAQLAAETAERASEKTELGHTIEMNRLKNLLRRDDALV